MAIFKWWQIESIFAGPQAILSQSKNAWSFQITSKTSNKTLVYKITSSFAIKKSRFDFADELKVGYVRYKHLTQITIKVQLFWRLPYEMLLYSKTNRLWVISDSKKVVE